MSAEKIESETSSQIAQAIELPVEEEGYATPIDNKSQIEESLEPTKTNATLELTDQANVLKGKQLLAVFFGLQLALFLSFLDATSVSTATPTIGRDLNSSQSIPWVGTAFLVANTSFQVVTSRLSDIFGRKYVLLGSLFFFILGDLLCGFAKNSIWLYCARAVSGIGGGGINSLCIIIMSDIVTLENRGKYQGLLGIPISLGSSVGPFVGGLFAQRVSWRWIFWIMPPMGVVTMVIIWYLVPLKMQPGNHAKKLRQMDWIGTFFSLAMTTCLLVPIAGGGATFAWNSTVVIALLCVGGVCALTFIYIEGFIAKLPLVPGRLFKNRNVCLIIFQTWFVGVVYYGNIYYAPIYFQNVRGQSAIASAALLLPLVVTQTFSSTATGYIVKRTGYTKPSFMAGFVLWMAGQCSQLAFKEDTNLGVIAVVLFIQGLGAGATLQTTLVLAQASGPPIDRAVVTGVRNFARTSGGAIGLATANTILNNVFTKKLPLDLPQEMRAQLAQEFQLTSDMTEAQKKMIIHAYMTAIRDVFAFLAPCIAICFFIGLFTVNISLKAPPPAPVESKVEEAYSDERHTEEEKA